MPCDALIGAWIEGCLCTGEIDSSVWQCSIPCLEVKGVRLRACTQTVGTSRIERIAVGDLPPPAAEELRQHAVYIVSDGKAEKVCECGIDVDRTCQFICDCTFGYACTAHHPDRVCHIGADNVVILAEHRNAVIGVEVYEIFIGAVMFLDIGEECSECTVEIAHSLPTGLFTERRRAQVGTRLATLRSGEPFRKRETSLHTRC